MRCPTCGRLVTAAMQIPRDVFERIQITRVLEWCWMCSHADWYERTDYIFVASMELEDVVIALP